MAQVCIFCKIASGEIKVDPVYEDEEFVAFNDVNPQAPVHVVVIPRSHYSTILDIEDPSILGRAQRAVQMTARALGLAEAGFRVVVNCGEDGGQTVYHLHYHVLGGRYMQWPPG